MTFSIWSLHPHDGHLQLNNWRRRFSFTTYFPFICRSAALKIKSKLNIKTPTWVEKYPKLEKCLEEHLLFCDQIIICIVWFHLTINRYKSIWSISWTWNWASLGSCKLRLKYMWENSSLYFIFYNSFFFFTHWSQYWFFRIRSFTITCFKLIRLTSGFHRLLHKVIKVKDCS